MKRCLKDALSEYLKEATRLVVAFDSLLVGEGCEHFCSSCFHKIVQPLSCEATCDQRLSGREL